MINLSHEIVADGTGIVGVIFRFKRFSYSKLKIHNHEIKQSIQTQDLKSINLLYMEWKEDKKEAFRVLEVTC